MLVTLLVAVFTGSSSAAAATCSNEKLRVEQGSQFLPDCRAYELVSPVEKNGADVAPGGGAGLSGVFGGGLSSRSGNTMAFASTGAFADPHAGALQAFYVAARHEDGWSSQNVNLPQQPHQGLGYSAPVLFFSSDLKKEIVSSRDPHVDGTPQQLQLPNLFLHDILEGTTQLVTTTAAPLLTGDQHQLVDASADMKHVLFRTSGALTPNATPGVPNLYEWIENATPELRLVGILPDGTPQPGGAAAAVWSTGVPVTAGQRHNAVSDDGTRILFLSGAVTATNLASPIYMRVSGSSTIEISESQRENPDPNGQQLPMFGAATPDQEYVFFTSSEKLTDDATTGPTSEGSDLYRYETSTGELIDLTVHDDPQDAAGAEVVGSGQTSGVIGTSTNGKRVYFMARGKLAEGGVSNDTNIYVWDDGEIKHVTTGVITGSGASRLDAHVAPSGRYLAFVSEDSLTDDDLDESRDAYLYDAQADELFCASCTDGSDEVDVNMLRSFTLASFVFQARHFVTDTGRVFFDTKEALVGRDQNGRQDVYQYQHGELSLISSGRGSDHSSFYDASPTGDEVFFSSSDQLVGQDRDSLMDAYVARVDGGLPGPEPESGACQGSECQGSIPPPPSGSAPGSATYVGSGNGSRRGERECSELRDRASRLKTRAKRLRKRARHVKKIAKRSNARRNRDIRQRAKRLQRDVKKTKRKARRAQNKVNDCRKVGA